MHYVKCLAFYVGMKQLCMELIYRHMRQHQQVLTQGDKRADGQWNYDHADRK